ncbi:MAG: AAA domain-containing protein [Desulfomonilaceae bacterium]
MNTAGRDGLGRNDKVTRLIEYLTALARIDYRKVIRDVEESDDYKRVLWLHEFPHDPKYCFVQAWGEEDESGEGVWIAVEKFREPPLPRLPDKCRDWIKLEALKDINEIPELSRVIEFTREEADPETGEVYETTETRHIEDCPEVQQAWDAYIEKQWLPWTDVRRRYEAVDHVYSKLFQIYQDQQRKGEQYELVVSLGLLTWLTPTGHRVHRHLLSATASLEFDPYLGKFTAGPSIEGAQVRLEFDMLDPEDHPQNSKELSEDTIKALGDNPWERSAVDLLLKAIANSLPARGDGEYYSDGLKPIDQIPSERPVVEFAPALILRKRSLRSLERVLIRIKEQVSLDRKIPHGFLALCESVEDREGWSSEEKISPKGDEIYFPLPANEEQLRIIDVLDRRHEVLVQGPPGTGKSHTIANLICHLLATGKRVLVTAKTPRALKVLHDKLPAEIKDLCINLLGHGTEERQSLEKSVGSILAKLDTPDDLRAPETIQRLERQIREKVEKKVQIDNSLLALRESETHSHYVADGAYQGTAARIARNLNAEEKEFSWFEDHIASDGVLPLKEDEISWLSSQMIDLDEDTERQLKLSIPDPDLDLPDADTIRTLFAQERAASEKTSAASERLQCEAGRALRRASSEIIEQLKSRLENLADKADTFRQESIPWIRRAVDGVLMDNYGAWKERLNLSKTESCGLRALAAKVDGHELSIPQRIDRSRLIIDAQFIKVHLEDGGTMGFWWWKPKLVKEHGAFLEEVKVDGSRPVDLQTLEILVDYLDLDQRLKHVWSLWRGEVRQHVAPPLVQIAKIETLNSKLDDILQLYCLKESTAEFISSVNGLVGPKWEDSDSLRELVETCKAVQLDRALAHIRKQLEKIEHALEQKAGKASTHPVAGELLEAFKKRNYESILRLLDQTLDLRKRAEAVRRKSEIIGKLDRETPKLVSNLRRHTERAQWAERLTNLTNAWAWARARAWLNEFLTSDSESLNRESMRLSEEIRRDLARLAALKAWGFCLDRMRKHSLGGHLASWQQAMTKYGKGTGTHAHYWLGEAQRHLNECRDAVPGWIMPIHRVYETVQAASGVFDAIIVDEASQCGPESLPLLYLGERLIIVGDDKQISPEAVAVDRSKVQRLVRDFLLDFAHRDSFDVETSLFDHGRIRFGYPITLREHFRCMPEIIHFSNNLCYKTSPLIPLRQYPPNRLNPVLKLELVSSGYREGKREGVMNRPEAEKLAEAVSQCCEDEQYKGLTMGVIVLQGQAQASVIEDILVRTVGVEEMAERRLICGNPYMFQGDERDIIFLSMVAGPNEKIGKLSRMPDVRRFNVAISRAKDQIWLFYSDIYNKLSEECLRRRLIDYFRNPKKPDGIGPVPIAELREKALRANRMIEGPPDPFDSWFEVDVALDIANQGYRVVPQFEFGGKRIDLVVQGGWAQLAVECYGDHWHTGEENFRKDLERQRKLESCGWRFFIVKESSYRAAPEEALKGLWQMLDGMGIYTVPSTAEEQSIGQDNDSKGKQYRPQPTSGQVFQNGSDEEHEETRLEDVADNRPIARADEDGGPKTIQNALRARREVIGRAIIRILQERPNNSCKKDSMSAYILSRWSIRTRGTPRGQFTKKVDDVISVMERAGHIIVYKATNVRIKLGWVPYPGLGENQGS